MSDKYFIENGRFIQGVAATPLVYLKLDDHMPGIWCKLEFMNPSGSCKDRIARYILEKAWRKGTINHGDTVIEASSGSTSIALALTCAQMGLKFKAVMSETVSSERVMIIKAYGGETISIPAEEGIEGAILKAEQEAEKYGWFLTNQFKNSDNPEAHKVWTGSEVLSQHPHGIIDAVVNGVGTGGTLVGMYSAFSDSGCPVQAFAARPINSNSAISDIECCSFSTRIPGVLDGITELLSKETVPGYEVIEIDEVEAIKTTRKLMSLGFPVGPSSGLNYAAALKAAERLGDNAQIVTVFPDRMERYFSTGLFG